ncbi:MAG: hypothetical protein Q8Q08_00375 [Candidatus Omnitrophota bacterium]|nr:hypothetical protein [Candidatus Omnitrophota bacterium]MDZ4241957.1 hypothetical protein [Candidatus Omnitrophota bacterium]
MLEFSFCMIATVILLLGMIKIFVWCGKDLVARRKAHENVLRQGTPVGIRPVFYYSTRMGAAVDSNIFGN